MFTVDRGTINKERVRVKEMKAQVTLICSSGKYKPMSTLVTIESKEDIKTKRQEIIRKGVESICHYRHTDTTTLKRQDYTQVKVRLYDLEEINKQKKIKQLREIMQKRVDKQNKSMV